MAPNLFISIRRQRAYNTQLQLCYFVAPESHSADGSQLSSGRRAFPLSCDTWKDSTREQTLQKQTQVSLFH